MATSGRIADFNIINGELSYGNFGLFGDTAQFMNISPRGKVGTIYLDSSNYIYAQWAFASTGFGVTDDGHVYANSMNVLNCNGNVSQAVPNVKWVNTNIDSAKTSIQSWVTGTIINQTTPTSDSTSTDKVPSYAACASMIRNIKNYVDNKLSTAYNNGYSAGYSVGYSAGYSAGAASASASSGSSSS